MFLICFGTRPEYIKVKSLIENLSNIKTCFTGQHPDLLKDIPNNVDFKLNINNSDSTKNRLNDIFIAILKHSNIFEGTVEYVLVQGDTTTACAIGMAAFHHHKKVIHLEAGLRTNNIHDPFPEEMNRQVISRIANLHLCPTHHNKQNLLKENIPGDNICVVGNTGLDNISKDGCEYTNLVLVTLHRRDNHNIMDQWFEKVEYLANQYPEIKFIIPLHPNPNVQKHRHLFKTVDVVAPLGHEEIIKIIKKCKFIISDSGGLQEEASFLNKKIIVCRKTTERPESVGVHSIMCACPEMLVSVFEHVNNDNNYKINAECPYGDGKSYKKIINFLE